MAKTLVITNLKPEVTEVMIKNFLFQRGKVLKIKLVKPQSEQQGYAYVELDSDKDAANVVRSLNGSRIKGQRVNISRIT